MANSANTCVFISDYVKVGFLISTVFYRVYEATCEELAIDPRTALPGTSCDLFPVMVDVSVKGSTV